MASVGASRDGSALATVVLCLVEVTKKLMRSECYY